MSVEILREFGIDMYTLLYIARTYCIAQGILLSVTWQPGWEKILGENGYSVGFPGGSNSEESACNADLGSTPGSGRSQGEASAVLQPTPVLLPGEFHGQKSLASYSPCSHRVGQD